MIKIYHNNRCSKSRSGLEILQESGQPFETIKYLETSPTFEELKHIISLLNIKPTDLVRKNEVIWKENYKGQELSDSEIINAMIDHPKLMERPIVINGDKAVIGRPPEIIKTII